MAAEIVYPTRGNYSLENSNRMISIYDTLYIQYNSSWDALTLTLYCLQNPTAGLWYYHDFPSLSGSGTFKVGSVQAVGLDVYINQYPTNCHYRLARPPTLNELINGESFWVINNAASPTTFQPTTATTSISTASTPITTSTTTTTSSSASSSSTSTAQPSRGLSTGAKAGIGVGVTATVLILAALLFIIWRMRRKTQMNRQESPLPQDNKYLPRDSTYEKAELPVGPLREQNFRPYKHEPQEQPVFYELEDARRRHELPT